MKINSNICNNVNILGFITIVMGLCFYKYKKYCQKITFENIEKIYKKKYKWENELEIYEIAMPRFYTNTPKKKQCILFIGGYKDIPYVWADILNLFISDGYDFYAPRTFGNGRSFFQITSWKDWIITYIESIYLLQEQYETIDIISFSTGASIALYLTQFEYKCKINNVFLCAPFLLYKPYLSIKLFFSPNIFSYILNRIISWTIRFHPKLKSKFAGVRDIHYNPNSINDFCEIFGDLEMETVLFDFIKFKPKQINASNVIIFYPNDDDVIGNIKEQYKLISNIFSKPIDLISFPSYITNSNIIPNKCAHVMFKEHPIIIQDIYNHFKKYL